MRSFRILPSSRKSDTRKAVGWTLLALGALSTVPLVANLLSRRRRPLLAGWLPRR